MSHHASPSRTVAITGASGFIGSHLVEHFARRGWRVVGLCRNPSAQPAREGAVFRIFALDAPIVPGVLDGVDAVVHTAVATDANDPAGVVAVNVEGARRLRTAAFEAGCRHFVFLSSLSAIQAGRSRYAQHKRAIEDICGTERDLVIRPGLTLGRGGLAQALYDTVRTRRLVPLIDGGRQPVYTVGVDELCDVTERAVARGLAGRYSLAYPEPTTMRDLLAGLAATAHAHPAFVPIPYWAARLGVACADTLRVRLPVTREHLEGLRHLDRLDVTNDLRMLDAHVKPLADTLAGLSFEQPLS